MTAPKRVQMTRNKPWRDAHPDAVIVDRRTKWGNWFVVSTFGEQWGCYRESLVDPKAFGVFALDKRGRRTGARWAGFADRAEATRFAVDLYRRSLEATYLELDGPLNRDFYMGELRGKDLACWCPLDQPCHADVLLELANPEVTS